MKKHRRILEGVESMEKREATVKDMHSNHAWDYRKPIYNGTMGWTVCGLMVAIEVRCNDAKPLTCELCKVVVKES